MEKESEYLFHLLGAYVRGEAPGSAAGMELEKLRHLARIHSVMGVFGYMAMKYRLFPEMVPAFRRECMATISTFGQRAGRAEQLLAELTRRGIDHVLMKGYILKDYYPVPELRTFGDIDMVIRREDREKTHALMQELGFQVKTDWEPVYSYVKPLEHYEFHTELLETDISEGMDCRAYFQDPWQHAVCSGNHRHEFAPEYHFLYMLAHLAKHVRSSGAGARMYLDLAAFIRHFGEKADWAWIRGELEKIRLAPFANTALTFVERYFGVTSPLALEPVEEQVLEALATMTADGGIFGRIGLDRGVNTLKEQGEGAGRAETVLRRLFPGAKTIERRYTYLQKRPWLLPVAWLHRLVITRGTWGDHVREARRIMQADLEDVRQIQQLHRAIGLGGVQTERRILEPEVLLEEYRRILAEEPEVEALPLVIAGSSMAPFLIHGRDTVYLSRLTRPIRRGDMLLYRRRGGRYILHRVWRVDSGGLTMVGDAQQSLEPGIQSDQVIAIVTKVVRKGKEMAPRSFWWLFFEKIWIRMVPLRRPIHGLYTWLKSRK